jgi:regulatory protein
VEEGKPKSLTPKEARERIEAYCAYRERSQQEVKQKLYEFGLYTDLVNEIISELIQNNFLNEERFARAFVRGKFSIKKWGRIKIRQALYPHYLSDYVLNKAFTEIDEDQYQAVLEEVIAKKSRLVKEKNEFRRNGKIAQYAIGRGFEPDMVWEVLKSR